MPWVSLLHNPEGITSVHEGSPPDLLGVRLHEVVLHRDGPTLRPPPDLRRFPDRPPRTWAAQGFDTLQVEISLSGVREVEVAGFGTAVTADVRLGADNGVTLDVTSPETRVRAVAASVFVSKLSALLPAVLRMFAATHRRARGGEGLRQVRLQGFRGRAGARDAEGLRQGHVVGAGEFRRRRLAEGVRHVLAEDAVAAVVDDQPGDRQVVLLRRRQLGDGVQGPAVAGDREDRAGRVRRGRAQRRRE